MVRFPVAESTLPSPTHPLNVHEGTFRLIRLTYDVEPGVPVEAYLLQHSGATASNNINVELAA